MEPWTDTYSGPLAEVLGTDDLEMNAHILRIFVLAEDNFLEIQYMNNPKLACDVAGKGYTNFYAVRNALQTLRETHSAIEALNDIPLFRKKYGGWSAEYKTSWKHATQFFKKNMPVINKARNAIGGHFSRSAARFVVQNWLDADAEVILSGSDSHHYAAASYSDVFVSEDRAFRDTLAQVPRNPVKVITFNDFAVMMGIRPH